MKHLQDGETNGTNVFINNLGRMTKMAAMPKTFKNLLQNWWTNFKETWHVASVTKVLQCVEKL